MATQAQVDLRTGAIRFSCIQLYKTYQLEEGIQTTDSELTWRLYPAAPVREQDLQNNVVFRLLEQLLPGRAHDVSATH